MAGKDLLNDETKESEAYKRSGLYSENEQTKKEMEELNNKAIKDPNSVKDANEKTMAKDALEEAKKLVGELKDIKEKVQDGQPLNQDEIGLLKEKSKSKNKDKITTLLGQSPENMIDEALSNARKKALGKSTLSEKGANKLM